MRYPHLYTNHSFKNSLISIAIVGLIGFIFNSYKLGKYNKQNEEYKRYIIGTVLLTVAVAAFLVLCFACPSLFE